MKSIKFRNIGQYIGVCREGAGGFSVHRFCRVA